jgi:hypothetical protein
MLQPWAPFAVQRHGELRPAACGSRAIRRLADIDILLRGKVQRSAILELLHKVVDPPVVISIIIHGSGCPGHAWSVQRQANPNLADSSYGCEPLAGPRSTALIHR